MPLQLGQAYLVSEPQPPTGDERRHQELLAELMAVRDALWALAQQGPPQVTVPPVDLSEVIHALDGLGIPGVSHVEPTDPGAIGQAVADALAARQVEVPDRTDEVIEELKRIGRKFGMALANSMPVVSNDISSNPTRILGQVEVTNYAQFPSGGGSPGGTVEIGATSLAALETVSVGNFPATQTVDGTVALDGATLAALETVNAVVSGTVALDAGSLAALETITADVTGTVALDAPTLAALESVTATVSGTVALDSGSLAALETVTATVSGTVALDSGSLAALETVSVANFPATQPVSGAVSLSAGLPSGTAAIGYTSPNGFPLRTYTASRTTADVGAPTGVTIVANTRKALLQLHHLAAATTTKRIRRITVGALAGAAVQYGYELYRVTAAPTAGTALTPQVAKSGSVASTAVATYNPTASGAITGVPLASATILGATTGHATLTLYEWNPGSDTEPLEIRAGVLEGYTLFVRGTGIVGPDPQIIVEYTEVP